ncbi:MAG: hypothetical protein JWP34_5097, partial [Massilia sp.]|nr:hypothetical protein [Massilia sp.]
VVGAGQAKVAGRVGPQVDRDRAAGEGRVLWRVAAEADHSVWEEAVELLDRLPRIGGGGALATVLLPVQFVEHRQGQDQVHVMPG